MSHVGTALIGAVAAVGAMLLASPEAHAEVSMECWRHLAAHPGTTAGADRRFHLERGEPSVCTEQEANAIDGTSSSSRKRDDERPHFDRPGRGCKWTLDGRKCG